jgi:Ala-tRNA(Pro) deacylase
MNENAMCERLQTLFDEVKARYRLVEHVPEGRTDLASIIRGNPLGQAAKAMVLMASEGKKSRLYILAVVPGDRRIDFNALKVILRSSYVGLAPVEKAKELTGCSMGSVPPFSFNPSLRLVVDRRLIDNEEIVFNAGRLDRSIFLSVEAYLAIARPEVHDISQEA